MRRCGPLRTSSVLAPSDEEVDLHIPRTYAGLAAERLLPNVGYMALCSTGRANEISLSKVPGSACVSLRARVATQTAASSRKRCRSLDGNAIKTPTAPQDRSGQRRPMRSSEDHVFTQSTHHWPIRQNIVERGPVLANFGQQMGAFRQKTPSLGHLGFLQI